MCFLKAHFCEVLAISYDNKVSKYLGAEKVRKDSIVVIYCLFYHSRLKKVVQCWKDPDYILDTKKNISNFQRSYFHCIFNDLASWLTLLQLDHQLYVNSVSMLW